ncbi:MAG: hypothetical protein ACRDOM_01155 [Nocardioides sp.]
MQATRRLLGGAAAILVLNAVATLVAIVVNWPAQFGGVGTDAGEEFLLRGTAISAPLLPVVLLVVVLLGAWAGGRGAWVAVVAAYLTAAVVAVGGVGEMVAEATTDTPKAVLVGAGAGWLAVAGVLVVLATGVVAERRRAGAAIRPS